MVEEANHLQNNLAAEKIRRGGDLRVNLSCLFIKIFIFLLGSFPVCRDRFLIMLLSVTQYCSHSATKHV